MPTASEARRHQRTIADLTTLAIADLVREWGAWDLSDAQRVRLALNELIPQLVDAYGLPAAAVAADWYEDLRAVADAARPFDAITASIPTAERVDSLAGYAIGPLFGATIDSQGALSLAAGGLQRLVSDMDRGTIENSVALDPIGVRYARHASANACAFCAMLATRGASYVSGANASTVAGQNLGGKDYRRMQRTGATRAEILSGSLQRTIAQGGRKARATSQALGSKYHDHCHCVAVPVFPGQEYEEAPYVAKFREAYASAGTTNVEDALRSMRAELGAH